MKRKITTAFLILLIAAGAAFAAPPSAQKPEHKPAQKEPAQTSSIPRDERSLIQAAHLMRSQGKVQLNFTDLEVSKFVHFMSELLSENILIDPTVQGKVSVVSPRAISLREAREIMISVLEMNGLALQDMGSYSKVVPLSDGPSSGTEVVSGDYGITPSEATAVQVVPLKFVKADFVATPVRNTFRDIVCTPIGNGSSISLSGKASSLNKAVRLIKAMDTENNVKHTKVFQLTHAGAGAISNILSSMGRDNGSKLAGTTSVADERTRKVTVTGSSQALREVERLLVSLDVPSKTRKYHVYKLENADARMVAEQLGRILGASATSQPQTAGGLTQTQTQGQENQPQTQQVTSVSAGGTTVVADLPTNSLIFSASNEEFEALKSVLKELDVQPKQVLLRGFIAEVNLSKLSSAGIDWSAYGGDVNGSTILGGTAQLGNSSVPETMMDLYQSLTTTETAIYNQSGNAVGTITETQGMGLIYGYVKLLSQYDAINVLSMPQILCTDNMQSSLQVGQVIPQLKGSLTDTTNTTSVTNSYDYKDVGLILTVTPHIRSGNLVALDIEQRVEDVITSSASTTPITSKREIKTNVLAANGQTIILGGLIKEAEKVMKSRVPVLSYIPIIGGLFKNNGKDHEKIDLMIFLTPDILETPQQAADLTKDLMDKGAKLSDAELGIIKKYDENYQKSLSGQKVTESTLHSEREEKSETPKKSKKRKPAKEKEEVLSEPTDEEMYTQPSGGN